jgi:hypothetical protein
MVLRTPPDLVAARSGDVAATVDAAMRFSARLGADGPASRAVGAAQVALLQGSPDGRAYSAVRVQRAFVLGAPPAQCPARVAAAGGAAPGDAMGAALRGCFAQLRAAAAPDACGCRVVAADDLLLAPLADFAYAPGVSGWIEAPSLGLDLHLAVREESALDGARVLRFLTDLGEGGSRIEARLAPDGAATMIMRTAGAPPQIFTGVHRPEGMRRGRYADRLRLRDDQGREAVVLVGYEPVEYATRRAELMAWR